MTIGTPVDVAMDGRDTLPTGGLGYLRQREDAINQRCKLSCRKG